MTPSHKEVLSLRLRFCPSNSLSSFELVKDIQLFARRLAWKDPVEPEQEAIHFFSQSSTKKVDFRAICDLIDLLHEGGDTINNLEFDYDTGEFVYGRLNTLLLNQIFLPCGKNPTSF